MPKLSELISAEVLEQVRDEIPEGSFDKDISEIDFLPDNGSYVPRKRLNDKTQEIEALESQLDEREDQIKQLKEDTQATEELKAKIEDLEKQNKKDRDKLEKEKEQIRKESAIEIALTDHNARNLDAAKALLDMDKIKVDGDEVLGLEDQLEGIKEENDFLFEVEEDDDPTPDTSGGEFEGGSVTPENNPFKDDNLDLQKQGELVKNHPNRARDLIKEANKDPSKFGL